MASDPLLGLTTLLVLLAQYGYFQWLGTRVLDDDSHRVSLLAASLGTLLNTTLVVTVGDHTPVFVAAIIPWIMVATFAYRDNALMAVPAGIGAWAIWWGLLSIAGWLAALREATAVQPFA